MLIDEHQNLREICTHNLVSCGVGSRARQAASITPGNGAMSLPGTGESLDKESSAEKEAEAPQPEKTAEITEDSAGENKDEGTEGPPAKKKAEQVFPTEKSALQLLQEHCDKSGDKPVFEWDTVGDTAALRFICRARVGVEIFTGAGISKKASKQSAARAALEVLELKVDSALADAPKSNAFTPEGENPITVLTQLNSRKQIPTAVYEVVEETVMANRMQFTMSCRVGKVMETGSGPCKKVAKQAAALRVLERLKRDQTLRRAAYHAESSRNFSEHRRDLNDSRARFSTYPSRTRPFQEHPRGPASQTFNSTLERNSQYPLSEVFTDTGSIRPLMERRLDHNVEEMHRAPGYFVQGALNTGTTSPLMGNQRCHSAHEFYRDPMDRVQYPLAHGSLNSEMDRTFTALQQQDVDRELYTTPRDDAQFNMARPTLHSGTVRPLMDLPHSGTVRPLVDLPHSGTIRPLVELPQDHSPQEKRVGSGDHALEPRFQRTMYTDTIRPLQGHPQHPSSEILKSPPGGNAQYPLEQALNSGTSTSFQTQKQDTVVPEFHPAPKDNTQFQLAQYSLNPGTIRPVMEHRSYYPSNQELDVVSKNSAQHPWHQTSVNKGMIGPVREHHQEVSALQLNTALGKNADYIVTPLKLSSTPNQTPEQQRCTIAQETNTELGHNTGYSGAFMNPSMIKPLQEHQQDPSTRGLGHSAGYVCSSLNPAMVNPHQEKPRNPSNQQSNQTHGNDAQYTWSSASQNTAAVVSSLDQQGHLKPQESSSAPRTNEGLTLPLYTVKPTSILGQTMKHEQESSAKQVTTQPGMNARSPLASQSPSINPLMGLWQGARALGFNMK
ncbi:uncharacterized protein LOC144785956 [Lissotriton helveticus]